MFYSDKVVYRASDAIEALVKWEPCDCGCPQQRSPATREDSQLLRIAAFIRIELLEQNSSAQAPGNE